MYTSGWGYYPVYYVVGVRPSVSLKKGIESVSGDGSFTKPFVIE